MKRTIAVIACFCVLAGALPAFAGQPLETVRTAVNQVLQILTDPALRGKDKVEEKKAKLEALADQMFDYTAMSRLTLGRNWRKLNPAQQKEFVSLYKQLLEKNYMDRILAYSNEKVVFEKQVMFTRTKAEVHSAIVRSDKKIPIYYRLRYTNGKWRIYDVIIEGISLVKNYRSQFNTILVKDSPAKMLQILRQKVG